MVIITDGLVVPITAEQMSQLSLLDNENFSSVIRLTEVKMREKDVAPILSAEEAEKSLKQYYALPILQYPRREFAVSSIVDEYWHIHILHTKGYREFCNRIFGHFADHVPLDKTDKVEFARVKGVYTESRNLLKKYFGDSVSNQAYPDPEQEGVVICVFDYCITLMAA